jgi:hypothetical protein
MHEELDGQATAYYRCESCDLLVTAFRAAERECRIAQDEHAGIVLVKANNLNRALAKEEDFLRELETLKRNRDCALEVLLKHQRYEHA